MVKDMKLLDAGTIQEATGSLYLADGNTIQISAVGTRTMQVDAYSVALRNTYYAEGLLQNLFSVRSAIQEGAEVSFSETDPHIAKEEQKYASYKPKERGIYHPKHPTGRQCWLPPRGERGTKEWAIQGTRNLAH